MDPNLCLQEIRTVVAEENDDCHKATKLAELIDALDEWMTKGGFAPTDWQK